MEQAAFVACLQEVEVVPVGRKGQRIERRRARRDYLSVAAGGHVPEPEAVQSVFPNCDQYVFSVGRYGGEGSLPGIRQLADGILLKCPRATTHEERAVYEKHGHNEREDDNPGDPYSLGYGTLSTNPCGCCSARWRRRDGTRSRFGYWGNRSVDLLYPAGTCVAFQALQVSPQFGGTLVAQIVILFHGLVKNL